MGPQQEPCSLTRARKDATSAASERWRRRTRQFRLLAWLLCDGAEYPRATYPQLFDALAKGQIYGPGNGATTFNVPDYRGYFLRGVDDPDGSGGMNAAGRDPEANSRRHVVSGMAVSGTVGSTQGGATAQPTLPFSTPQGGGHAHQINRRDNQTSKGGYGNALTGHPEFENVIGDGGHSHVVNVGGDRETRPINIYVNWLIRASSV